MFLGHFGAALAAKRLAPAASLGTLVAAAQLLDLAWPVMLLLGVEEVRVAPGITAVTPLDFTHYPWTHSLATVVLWGALFAALHRWRTGAGRASLVVGALVVSHWLLDLLVHRPDLPLAPGGPRVGLGLWDSLPATLLVEGLLFAAGVAAYATATRPRDGIGRGALWALVAFLVAIYAASLAGPPPPGSREIGLAGLATLLFVPWGAWIDRHRELAAARPG